MVDDIQVKQDTETWYKQRRVWSAICATISSVMLLFISIPYVDKIAAGFGIIAAALAGDSFVRPK